MQSPPNQLQEARLERRRSRSFEQRQPWLGTPETRAAGARSPRHTSKRLLRDLPGAFKPSHASTTGLASLQRAGASQPQSSTPSHPIHLLNGMIHQIRVLLDSGANLSLINNDDARKRGLPGDTVNINLNVAGEVSFQLVSMNKSFVSKSMYAVTTSSVSNPFNIIDFNPERLSLIHI